MRTPSLRQIEAFMAFIDAGTVSRAADVLRISQPAASKLLMGLEEDTELQLFERDGRRLVLTDRGMRLYQEIDRIFTGVHQIDRAVDIIRREERGRLLIGVMPAFSGPILRRAVVGFLKRHPDVYISVYERSSEFIAGWLARRQLDVGIISMHVDDNNLISEPLVSRPLVCVLPKDHRLASRAIVTPQDFIEERFIAFAPGSQTRRGIEAIFERYDISLNIVIDATTAQNVCEFVAGGLGITLAHPLFVEAVRDRVSVTRFEPSTAFDFLLCRPREVRNLTLVDAFQEETRKAAVEASPAY